MKRIGLTQRVQVVEDYGERRDCLDQRWAAVLGSIGLYAIPLPNGVEQVEGYVGELGLDGVILTGGNDLVGTGKRGDAAPERDRFEHRLIDFCADRRVPVLGVCRGLQMLNVHHGGSLSLVGGHAGRRHEVVLDDPVFGGQRSRHDVNSYHDFGITQSDVSPTLKPAAWCDDETVEALIHPTLPQLGVMWHPERELSPSERDLTLMRKTFLVATD